MTEYTASNGVVIRHYEDERIDFKCTGSSITHNLTPNESKALYEFAQYQEDERLGRWRSKSDPDIVAYRLRDEVVRLVDESGHGNAATFYRNDQDGIGPLSRVAREFFAAHPEPKPWHDAKPGEVWVLTVDGTESAFYPSKSLDRAFTPVAPNTGTTAVSMDWPLITAGRRIYPEVAS